MPADLIRSTSRMSPHTGASPPPCTADGVTATVLSSPPAV
jgi:hypothetical protein